MKRRQYRGSVYSFEALERRELLAADWVTAMGGTGSDRLWDSTTDSAGNTYIVGEFSGTANFGNKKLNSSGASDVFVAKLNSSGTVQWAQRAGGSEADLGYSVALGPSGELYVTGYFAGSAKFGNTTLKSAGGTDAFLTRLNTSNGNFQWAQKVGGSGDDRGTAVEVDPSGRVIVTAGLNGGNFLYAGGGSMQYGASQLFVGQFTSSGSQQWTRTVSGTGMANATFDGLDTDAAGNIYVAGAFAGSMNLPTGMLTSTSTGRDLMIGKLNASGTWQWGESVSGTIDADIRAAHYAGGQLYVTGALEGSVNFDSQVLSSTGVIDGFVASFDTTTRSFDWAQRFGGTGLDIGRAVATDPQGNVHVVGSYRNTAEFGSFTLVNPTTAGTTFTAMLDTSGNFLEALSLGGPGSNSARNIGFDTAGNRYIGGYFDGVANFPGKVVTSKGSIDSYVVRLAPAVVPSSLLAAATEDESDAIEAAWSDFGASSPEEMAIDEELLLDVVGSSKKRSRT